MKNVRNLPRLGDKVKNGTRDVSVPVRPPVLNLADPRHYLGADDLTRSAGDANRPEPHLPSMTNDLGSPMQRTITYAYRQLFWKHRPFSTLSDATGEGELKVTLNDGTRSLSEKTEQRWEPSGMCIKSRGSATPTWIPPCRDELKPEDVFFRAPKVSFSLEKLPTSQLSLR